MDPYADALGRYTNRVDRVMHPLDHLPWKRNQKPRSPPRNVDFNINKYVQIEEELAANKSFASSDEYPDHLYRICEIREQNSQFYEYRIFNVRGSRSVPHLEKWYREAELRPVWDSEARKIFRAWQDEDRERKQRGSRQEHEWDAKTLVGRDGEDRDDETLWGR